jgi:A/G-specific adenine glycosylase
MPIPLPAAADLLRWYDRHRRRMPWRALPGQPADPYRVWLSEVMLQQTTVAAVIPYYERFVSRFPTVQALAAAPLDDVLAAWAGLGYYARARNLHACARAVAALGGFPRDRAGLLSLPGIGPYTATAIAAIAYDSPGIPVDGNVERVAARLFAIETPLPGAKPALHAAAARLGQDPDAAARPSDYAQALFDLGATVCTPAAPPASPPPCRAAPPSRSARAAMGCISGSPTVDRSRSAAARRLGCWAGWRNCPAPPGAPNPGAGTKPSRTPQRSRPGARPARSATCSPISSC